MCGSATFVSPEGAGPPSHMRGPTAGHGKLVPALTYTALSCSSICAPAVSAKWIHQGLLPPPPLPPSPVPTLPLDFLQPTQEAEILAKTVSQVSTPPRWVQGSPDKQVPQHGEFTVGWVLH